MRLNVSTARGAVDGQAGDEAGPWKQAGLAVCREIITGFETLWAANAGDGTVSIVDIAGKKVVQTFPVDAKRSNRLKFTPDGKRVLISDLTNGGLIVVDVATRKEVKRLTLGHSVAGILVVPDGSRAYVAATNDNYVAVVDLKNLEVLSRISTGTGPDGMDWIASR